MKCMLHIEFLPYNFQRLMYQKLYNLWQGTHSYDDYTIEFYQLLMRYKNQEIEDQLVAHYHGCLQVQIQEIVNLFDPINVPIAHQWALQFEKQFSRRSSSASINTSSGGNNNSNRPRAHSKDITIQRVPNNTIQLVGSISMHD